MRLSCILIVISLMQITATGFSQNVVISIDADKMTLEQLFAEIEKQTDVKFLYRYENIENKVTMVHARNTPLSQVLTQVLAANGLKHSVMDNNLIVVAPEEWIQGISISGTITDETGEPMPGVNVMIKGTSTGVVSNYDGNYTINIPNENAILVFSFVGYATEEISVGERRVIDVNLVEDTQQLEEVVVVGYGTQRKVDLTGSVAAVKVDETLANRALSNVSSGLQGLLPGLAITQNSGMAGKNDVTMVIRGMGTVNDARPLVVIDGMPDGDINRVNMNDIESISVLKDAASASIYGSRAANGVILITTRTGKGASKTTVDVSANYGISNPTKSLEFMADYPRALTLHQRSALVNTAYGNLQFKDGTIDQWLALGMIDPVAYPNTDWWDWILRTGKMQNYNISATGSSDRANFFASVGVTDEDGLQVNNDYSLYNARFNFDYKVRDNMNVGVRFNGNWSKYTYYLNNGFTDSDNADNTGGFDLQYAIAGITPYDPETGYFGGVMAYGEDAQAYNPYTYLINNLNRQNRQELNASFYYNWEPIRGLTAQIDYSLRYYNQFRYTANMPNRAYDFQQNVYGSRTYVGTNAGVGNYTNTGYKTQLQGRINYDTKIGSNHRIGVMAGYSEEFWYNRSQSSSRDSRLHTSLKEIDAALTEVQSTGGNSNEEGLRSFIGRLDYNAFEKYMLQVNFRADGSSKFLKGHRWGYFPSVSAGWRFTEEDFVKNVTAGWLSSGKLRISYGSLGNNAGVGRYEQQETLDASNYMLSGSAVKGFVYSKMVNQNLTWESTTVFDVGLDLGFLNHRLTLEADYFDKLTTDMLRPGDLSLHLTGAYAAPRQNIGKLRNRGIDVNINWSDKIKDLRYSVNFNVSYYKSKLETWNSYLDKGWTYIDMPYHFVYTYTEHGIAQTWQDVYNSTSQGISPGDIMRNDVNGDGKIDSNDKVAYPEYQRDRPTTDFALNLNASWKGIDVSALFTGAAGRKRFWLTNYNNVNFGSQRYASSWEHWNNPWSWDNRDGEWPRLNGTGNREESTFWLDNMSYIRLKNVQIGYSLPKKWMDRLRINNVRVFVSGENLTTFTKYRGLDPEMAGRVYDDASTSGSRSGGHVNDAYPLIRTFSFGINISI